MASANTVSEEQATGRLGEIYREIKAQLGVDYVPNLYQAMAAKPGYLEANWHKVAADPIEPGKREGLDDDLVPEVEQ